MTETLWACRCGNEWMDDGKKSESQCQVCGLFALKNGGHRCVCGFKSFYGTIHKTHDLVCMMCGTHYGSENVVVHRGQEFLEK